MKHRKIIPDFFNDNELNVLSIVLQRVLSIMGQMGAYSEETYDSYRTRASLGVACRARPRPFLAMSTERVGRAPSAHP